MNAGSKVHCAAKSPGLVKAGRTLSVMPTYACPAQCKDCGTASSPHDRNNISLEIILAAIDQANDLGFLNVVFTGGEATLRSDDLLQAIAYAHDKGLPTRLVTNAHWAVDQETSDSYVRLLVDSGLDEINFSTGDEHARFVPVDHVVNGVLSAIGQDLVFAVMIELKGVRAITKDTFLSLPQLSEIPDEVRDKIIESPWMPLRPSVIENYPPGIAFDRSNVAAASGCDSVLQTYVVQADGRIGACCGLGMRITRELNVGRVSDEHFLRRAIEESEEDLLKWLLRYKGPEKLLAWAADKAPSIEWENQYAHKCQACMRLYKDPKVALTIKRYHHELIPEVLQAAWLEEELYPKVVDQQGCRSTEPGA